MQDFVHQPYVMKGDAGSRYCMVTPGNPAGAGAVADHRLQSGAAWLASCAEPAKHLASCVSTVLTGCTPCAQTGHSRSFFAASRDHLDFASKVFDIVHVKTRVSWVHFWFRVCGLRFRVFGFKGCVCVCFGFSV